MKKTEEQTYSEHSESKKLLIKQCHCCSHIQETATELARCSQCLKSFLPLKYFEKIHDTCQNYVELFSAAEELEEKDLIKGLIVLW